MSKIKKYLSFIISIVVVIIIALNFDKITTRLSEYVQNLTQDRTVKIEKGNEYTRNYSYLYLKNSEDYIPYSYEDLINIVYGILNQGWNEFTFYCPQEYTECLEDISKLSNDEEQLSHINNFVNPFNSYSSIKTIYDDSGEITIIVNHLYNEEEIRKANTEIDEIIEKTTNDSMSDKQKILAIHDYIINRTKYDVKRADTGNSEYDSARIQGLLYEHYAICSGYTDTMAIILDKLHIPNYKISSKSHIWNAVYIDGEWKHLDLTWDDPVNSSGKDTLEHNFFLIDSKTLKENDKKDQHLFKEEIYQEM